MGIGGYTQKLGVGIRKSRCIPKIDQDFQDLHDFQDKRSLNGGVAYPDNPANPNQSCKSWCQSCKSWSKMRTEFKTKRKIEFADTDMAGIVHFTKFFVFMETAEHEFLRSLGTSVATEWEGNKIGWPRVTASCEYLHPLRFEDEVDIRLWVSNKGSKSLTYQFLFTLDGVDVARGELTTVCCIANPGEKLQAIPIPDFLAAKISI